ncbi:MAG: SPOR domain-containing protein [Sandaracinaceae bacterium]|nr:SPOR domain-containing protein [Sandaracinaceae bacterium]MDW8246685.1 SPOR domain-containing protein [Sandaracinaceae bacterium]
MEAQVRDWNRIEEEKDLPLWRRMRYALSISVFALLVGAVFRAWFGTSSGEKGLKDPLAPLERKGLLKTSALQENSKPAQTKEELPPKVNRIALGFPEILSEEPPEAALILAKAAAEAEHPDPIDGLDEPAVRPSLERIAAMLPAAISASDGKAIARVATHDELVREAIPQHEATEIAREGVEGDYTLQVISFDNPQEAQAFAAGLRARGHRAFVTQAEVEGRGPRYRVRIGPFATLAEARAYRSRFEAQERMNTVIVKRPEVH